MKYYKITNEKEVHYGMKYKTGLNIDVMPFGPSGDCEGGGIYFAREDIFAFLHMGTWIREVTIPDGEKVYKNPSTPKKWKAHRVILGERKRITAKVIEDLIKEGADVHAGDDDALMWASYYGHFDVVKLLLDYGTYVHAVNDIALRCASYNGHMETVKLLLDHGADVRARDNEALRWALCNGHTEIAELLKKHMEVV